MQPMDGPITIDTTKTARQAIKGPSVVDLKRSNRVTSIRLTYFLMGTRKAFMPTFLKQSQVLLS